MNSELEYKIAVKGDILIVSFRGVFIKEHLGTLEACHKEVLENKKAKVILILKDVSEIDQSVIRQFSLFQQDIRKNHVSLAIVGLSKIIKQYLLDKGILRLNELKN